MRTSVEIYLGMNTRKLAKGVRQGLTLTKKLYDGIVKRKKQLRDASLKLGLAFAAELLFIKKVADAAGQQEAAENKLFTALKNTNSATEENLRLLKEQATAMQRVTKFGDEQIIAAQAILATYRANATAIKMLTPHMLDMAAASEKTTGEQADLKAVTEALGKALSGDSGTLSRYGVKLTEIEAAALKAATATERAELLSGMLEERFAGMATGAVDTYLGKKQQLVNIIGDLNEAIGFALLPMLTELIEKIKPNIEKAIEWANANQTLLAVLIGGGTAGTGLLVALSTLGFMLASMAPLIGALATPIGAVALVLTGLVALFVALKVKSADAVKTLSDVEEGLGSLEGKAGSLRTEIAKLQTQHADYIDAIGEEPPELAKLREEYGKVREEIVLLREERQKLLDAMGGEPKTYEEVAVAMKGAQSRLADLKESARQLEEQLSGPMFSVRQVESLNNSLRQNHKEQQKTHAVIKSLVDIRRELGQAERDQIQAEVDEIETAAELQTALNTTEGAIETLSKKIRFSTQVMGEDSDATARLRGELDALIVRLDMYRARLDALKGGGSVEAGVTGGTDEGAGLMEMPDVSPLTMQIDGARESLVALRDEFAAMPDLVNPGIESIRGTMEEAFVTMPQFFGAFVDGVIMHTKRLVETEKNAVKLIAKAFAGGFVFMIQTAVDAAVATLMVEQAKAIGMLSISGFLNPLNWIKIAPAVAAGAAAIAGVQTLANQFQPKTPSFYYGGVSPGGMVQTEPGEVMFNPRSNTLSDLGDFLSSVGVKINDAMPQAAGPSRQEVNVFSSNYGPIQTVADVEDVSRKTAQLVIDRMGRR